MTRLFGIMCVRNEANRYLADCIKWNLDFLDEMYVYDDGSEDASVDIAKRHGAVVERRGEASSFLDHEGRFREAAWLSFESTMRPDLDDVIVALDADEFMIHRQDQAKIRDALMKIDGETIKIVEVFDVDEGVPQYRTDGYWGDIYTCRVFRYKPDGKFNDRQMGSGSVPTYVMPKPQSTEVAILHYGYAKVEDRAEKHQRYCDHPGHSPSHVASILRKPSLAPWAGVNPYA